MRKHWLVWAFAAGAAAWAGRPAYALKPWALVEDGYPEPKGQLELENTFEADFHARSEPRFREFSLENELEYGLTDQFDLRAKISNVYTDSAEFEGLHFDAGGIEAQYYFTDPNTAPIGVSLIGALEMGERGLGSAEGFLVLQKDFDKFVLAYNLGAATDVEHLFSGGSKDTTGTLTNAFGFLYSLAPDLRLGAEISAESSYDEWRKYTGTTVYAGPTVNWIPIPDMWVTAGFDFLIGNQEDEPEFKATLIVGYYF
jgi:hypothetical protein